MEVPIVGGLVAQVERQLSVPLGRIGLVVKAGDLLEFDRALAQPIRLRHFFY